MANYHIISHKDKTEVVEEFEQVPTTPKSKKLISRLKNQPYKLALPKILKEEAADIASAYNAPLSVLIRCAFNRWLKFEPEQRNKAKIETETDTDTVFINFRITASMKAKLTESEMRAAIALYIHQQKEKMGITT